MWCIVTQDDCPTFSEGQSRASVLQAAAMAAKWWEPPRDALDTMVLNAADLRELEAYSHIDFMPFDPAVKVRGSCATSFADTASSCAFDPPALPAVLTTLTFICSKYLKAGAAFAALCSLQAHLIFLDVGMTFRSSPGPNP